VVTVSIDSIDFKVPIKQADTVELVARVERVGRTSFRTRVEVNREDPLDSSRELYRTDRHCPSRTAQAEP
jgi:acyl-CoA hydrolase